MSAATPSKALRELVEGSALMMPLTVQQYHRMIETGILQSGDPYELLDGFVVRKDRSATGADPMSVDPHHAWAVRKLAALAPRLKRFGHFMQTQQPVTLPPHDEPEPDGAIVRGTEDDYRDRHPGSDDVTCVIEVSDSSLRRDRTTKMRIYADAGIPQYVIINLLDAVIEVYSNPQTGKGRYAESTTLQPRQTLELPVGRGKRITVPAGSLLPQSR